MKATKRKRAATPVPKKSATPKKAAAKKRTVKDDTKQQDDGIEVRNLVMTNGIPVDHCVPSQASHEVVFGNGSSGIAANEPLNCNLTFADCGHNNNKFYIAQGLKYGSSYYLWTRWGRVGSDGSNSKDACGSLDDLIKKYSKKVKQKRSKGYTQIQIDYEEEKKESAKAEKKKTKKTKKEESKLPSQVQDLLKFIFDMNLIEKSVIKVGLNVKKLPLGKLSQATITDGYKVLKQLEKALKKKNNSKELSDLSSEFYRYIPHDFGYKKMSEFIINTEEKLKHKLDLVNSLADIRIAAEINNEVDEQDDNANELDAKYKMLKCKIIPIDSKHKHYKSLTDTIKTCKQAGKVTIMDVFEIEREGEAKKFKGKLGNRKLLWHGSRFSNWGGILSQGLRIAPPEAPASGYRFGKGIYFADAVAKSIPYTRYDISNNICLLAL